LKQILNSSPKIAKTKSVQKNQNTPQYLILGFEVVVLKEWKCVLVGHHDNVGKVIEDWEKAGWNLHTYTAAQMRPGLEINHYLLFEKGE
jgi:hypothetical protein